MFYEITMWSESRRRKITLKADDMTVARKIVKEHFPLAVLYDKPGTMHDYVIKLKHDIRGEICAKVISNEPKPKRHLNEKKAAKKATRDALDELQRRLNRGEDIFQ